jgi:hypothetical protein
MAALWQAWPDYREISDCQKKMADIYFALSKE